MNRKIAIVGAGPVGLEAGLRARASGFDVAIYEAGEVADAVRRWSHVRLFSPFGMNRSELGARVLRDGGLEVPADDALLTGGAFVERYLLPLSESALLRDCLKMGTRVISIGRAALLKQDGVGDKSRGDDGFRLLLQRRDGGEDVASADVVIDASGTFGQPRFMGQGGIPAIGELAAGDRIRPPLEDILGAERARYANRRTMVVGSGYSAATNVVALAELGRAEPSTEVIWVTRHAGVGPIHVIEGDRLPERFRLATAANALVRDGGERVTWLAWYGIERIESDGRGGLSVSLIDRDGRSRVEHVQQIIPNTGFMPDRSIYRELQVHECYATEGPINLAASLMRQTSGDCLDAPAASSELLRNPEPGFFIIGAKSYGRNSSFLLRAGLEQIDLLFGAGLVV